MHHPRLDENGKHVHIRHPHSPSDLTAWMDPGQLALVVPDGPMPLELHGVPFSTSPLALQAHGGTRKPSDSPAFKEPPFDTMGRAAAAGAVVVEPDGRVWLVAPTNAFGGSKVTFPKGKTQGRGLRPTAVKEVLEESGLEVELFSHLVDITRSTSRTRYYLARRLAGNPADMDWETQAVLLTPLADLKGLLNKAVDQLVLEALLERWGELPIWFPPAHP